MPMAENPTALMQQLHDEHAAALWGFCLHLTGDPVRAEDVAQETLLRAWQHYEVLDESRGSVRSWLFTVARNIVIDEWRSKRFQNERADRPRCPSPATRSTRPTRCSSRGWSPRRSPSCPASTARCCWSATTAAARWPRPRAGSAYPRAR